MQAIRIEAGNRSAASTALGFSLIELLVVIAIAAVLLGVTVPNVQQFLAGVRLSSASNEFFTALNVARSEAVRRGVQVTLITKGTAGSRDWTRGWQMFVDTNANGTRDAGEDILREVEALDAPMTIFGSANFGTTIAFDSGGRLTTGGGSFVICHGTTLVADNAARSRAVVINSAGRVRMGTIDPSTLIPSTDTGPVANCSNT